MRHELIIGVNRAATAWRCDWWVFADPVAYREFTPIGSPRIGTLGRAFEAIGPIEATVIDRLNTTCPGEIRWQQFSLTAAMVLGQYLGAARIVVYGADWRGTLDWDGTAAPVRHKDRWASEAHRFEQVKTWLTRCNIRVVRVIGETDMANKKKAKDEKKDAPAGAETAAETETEQSVGGNGSVVPGDSSVGTEQSDEGAGAGNETMAAMLGETNPLDAPPPPEPPVKPAVEGKRVAGGPIEIVMRRRMMVGDRMREVGEKVAEIWMAPDVSIHWFCRAFMDGFCGD